jgi:hypothetical protein
MQDEGEVLALKLFPMPQTLSRDAFRKSSNFMKLLARPLERAMFEHEFEGGAGEAVVDELSAFQNSDGGFGNGIEPDVWMRESSPLTTTVAMQYISAMGLPADHALVTGAIAYLIDSYDEKRAGWDKVSWEVEDAPHAPWWNFSPKLEGPFQSAGWGNPAAEIVGYLHEYSSLVPDEFLEKVHAQAAENFSSLTDNVEMHVLLCYLRLHERSDSDMASTMQDWLITAASTLVTTDQSAWKSYHTSPTWLAPTPDSLLAKSLSPALEPYLDYLVESQTNDGSWQPFWSWGDQYAHAWEVAKRQWAGHLTLINLRSFAAYGRLESA